MRLQQHGGLHGRDHEQRVIGQAVARLADRSGSALVIRGEPGAGKSALLSEATAAARRRGARVRKVMPQKRMVPAVALADMAHGG